MTPPDAGGSSSGQPARQLSERLVLSHDAEDEDRTRAFDALVARADEAHGIALHYAAGDPDAAEEAMSHALCAVAGGFAAAALEGLVQDEALELTINQKLRLDELIIALDLETSELLHGA